MSDVHLVKVCIEPWLGWTTRNPVVKQLEQVLKSSNNPLLGVQAQETQHIKQESIPEVTEVCRKNERITFLGLSCHGTAALEARLIEKTATTI